MAVRGIILDMDGTMFDTERMGDRAWAMVEKEEGIAPLSRYYSNLNGIGQKEAARLYRELYGDKVDYYALYRKKRAYMNELLEREGVPVKRGLQELLDFVRARGLRLALGTSSPQEYARHCLRLAGVEERFDAVVCGDMVEQCKPSPEIFETAAAGLGLAPEECMVVEDSVNGIRAAVAGRFIPVMVPDQERELPDLGGAHIYVLQSLGEVPALVKQLEKE